MRARTHVRKVKKGGSRWGCRRFYVSFLGGDGNFSAKMETKWKVNGNFSAKMETKWKQNGK